MTAVSASVALPVGEAKTARVGCGVLLDGFVKPSAGEAHAFRPGGLVSFGLETPVHESGGRAPAIDATFAVAATWAQTEDPASGARAGYFAADARLGLRATWQVADRFYPNAAVRVFGGPVNWSLDSDDVRGSDIHHYQLALGGVARVGSVAFFAEWAALGERGVSAGLSTAW